MNVSAAIAWLGTLPLDAEVDVTVRPPVVAVGDLFGPMTAAERARAYRRRKRTVTPSVTKNVTVRDGGVRGGSAYGSEKQAEKKEETGSTCQVDLGASVTASRDVRDAGKRRWRRVPEDWAPNDAHRELAASRGVTLDAELAKFRDHEFASAKTDADATFRNWLRNASSRSQGPRSGIAPKNASVALVARARRIEEEERLLAGGKT